MLYGISRYIEPRWYYYQPQEGTPYVHAKYRAHLFFANNKRCPVWVSRTCTLDNRLQTKIHYSCLWSQSTHDRKRLNMRITMLISSRIIEWFVSMSYPHASSVPTRIVIVSSVQPSICWSDRLSCPEPLYLLMDIWYLLFIRHAVCINYIQIWILYSRCRLANAVISHAIWSSAMVLHLNDVIKNNRPLVLLL